MKAKHLKALDPNAKAKVKKWQSQIMSPCWMLDGAEVEAAGVGVSRWRVELFKCPVGCGTSRAFASVKKKHFIKLTL